MADDDDYTQIFGVGSELAGWPLLLGFWAVGLYLLTFGSLLDKLEALTFGTSYHLVLQRIYREIMMVGFGSFAFTILNQTNVTLPYGLNTAFGFADICCFAMSSFFCLQGVFIMLLSVKQAQNWNVASQIPAEELLHNMSVWELSHPLAWRSRFLPFCPTREQVEFRVLKSIFATAYNLKASHSEFDFAIFLRMSHENNIVKLIDITIKNWVYILFMIAMQATTDYFYKTSCSTEACEIDEDIKIFTGAGIAVCILSIVAFLWGRYLELRLIASAGVEYVDDYAIFLMTEFRTEENLSDVATSATSAKDIIASYLKEKEINEVESKEEQYLRRHSMIFRSSGDNSVSYAKSMRRINELNEKRRLTNLDKANDSAQLFSDRRTNQCSDYENIKTDQYDSEQCLTSKPSSERICSGRKVSPVCYDEEKTEVQPFTCPDDDVPSIRENRARVPGKCAYADQSPTNMSTSSNISDDSDVKWISGPPIKASNINDNTLENRGNSMIVTRKKKKNRLFRLSSGEQTHAFFKKTIVGVSKAKRKLSRQASDGWRASVETMFLKKASEDTKLSANEREKRFAAIIKSNFGKQNFKELFLFKRPSLFYGLISFVITCNSLYLAWWATNYMFVILSIDEHKLRLWYILITLLPPIITFPTIFLAIRSSTIMQAITFLDLSVVAKVIEQSQINTTMLADFRKTILNFMKKDGPGLDGMIKCCNRFADGRDSVLKKSGFREMLLANRVIYTPEKINFLFGSIDLNGGSTVDYGELETFLFADDNYESDRKRQELFHKMTVHKVQGMKSAGKSKENNAAYRILNGLKFETFIDKNFVSDY